MALNYRVERNYASRLGDAADDLQIVRNRLNTVLENVQSSYIADERRYFDNAVNRLMQKIGRINSELNDLQADISDVAYEIYQEERDRELQILPGPGFFDNHGGGGGGF